jgi:mannitol-1-phosphate/altronate dehydrogenase
LSGEQRRAVSRRYNITALSALCKDAITGEPCQGETTDDGAHPRECKGIMAYVRYSLRAKADGSPVAMAVGQCDLCRTIGHVLLDLPR